MEFDILDHIMALKALIAPLKKDHFNVMNACLNANRALFPEAREVQSPEELIRNLNQAKTRLRLWRSLSARTGADAALIFIMSWHEHIELHKIKTLCEGSSWTTNPDLIKIREEAANFMAEFANTTHLDMEATVYSDEEAEEQSGSDAKESDDSSNQQYAESDGEEAGDSAEAGAQAPIQITWVRFSASGKTIIEQDTS